VIAACVACVSLSSSHALAADPVGAPSPSPAPPPAPVPAGGSVSPDQRARAQELFEKALADAQKGDFAAACPKFRASQEADPKTSTLLNLGNCYEKNGQTASAWGAFKEASVRAWSASRADWAKMADAHIAELEPKLAHISVMVPKEADAPGLSVMRDGVKVLLGERGVPIPTDAGEHELSATADGKIAWSTKLKVKDADDAKVTIPVLEDVPKAPPPPPRPNGVDVTGGDPGRVAPPPPLPAPYWNKWRVTGAVGAGVGVIGLTVGTVVGLTAKSSYDTAKNACNKVTGCTADQVKTAHDAIGTASISTGVFVAGAALFAAGAGVFFLAPTLEGKTGQLKIAPSVVGMQGLVAQGTF
jgi:tetratricopeptide (TPR) repeat protein